MAFRGPKKPMIVAHIILLLALIACTPLNDVLLYRLSARTDQASKQLESCSASTLKNISTTDSTNDSLANTGNVESVESTAVRLNTSDIEELAGNKAEKELMYVEWPIHF